MFSIVEHEIHNVVPIEPGASPNYNKNNPLTKIIESYEAIEPSAGLQHYLVGTRNFLIPFRNLALYGPSGDDWQVVDPRQQENKNDFQKQNVRSFDLMETQILRGYAIAGEWTGPYLHFSYAPSLASPLSVDGGPYQQDMVQLYLKVGSVSSGSDLIAVPYNAVTHRYEIEIWAYPKADLSAHLDAKGKAAMASGELIARPDLVKGSLEDFEGPAFDGLRDRLESEGKALEMFGYAVDHAMHPIRALKVEVAWASKAGDRWDSQNGENYRFEFAMVLRGWRNYLGAGRSANPHGGLGSLGYRNLFSNYFGYEEQRRRELGEEWLSELGREMRDWNRDAYGRKPAPEGRELFMAVNYMDLHSIAPNSAIGLHRHRDSLEAFLLISGERGEKAYMITGDWAKHDKRERAFEIRTMTRGDIVLIRGGQLHALINDSDTPVELFMFGGYD
ncbi:cupin domain-containing protein [Novosphingobium sp. AP12]|uniref:cupin domain-containing protein n=1 Tax=Novosphingobium sp. AP12 TaxID=1144305 RepID=UPI000271E1D1|nr:cupin domain-containing protein [Novosphingobium sp. AP12]EJL35377.1 cupin domain-containing protein [Novosphingobium sp. AP12]